ncbi:DNA ligase 1 [Puccinia graminis f. sp. tritici CRL 75-36-700-3]|uniref:DNA ligase n=1 Tax=Puccinia graminis f. sp. tritici (strain CRL 75-36-700-3 / race SCCL) TaxID=418459 RepID=E3KPH7_PUCGT|nr:DNA ligase 1 [Puccinia graminis f. sp. tritici CRL 75-36-700-3]EFP86212.2 DNA ligase 1 [Puccinia graminis f. sp. tritici CRL 75-36-700-3]
MGAPASSSSNSNGPTKQATLNKFFSKPAGHKPALVQATVNSLFNKQNRKKSEEKEEDTGQGHVSRDLKRAPSIDVEEHENPARSSKRAKSNQTKKAEENDDDKDAIKATEEPREEPKPTKKISKKQSKTKVEEAEELNELKVSNEPIQKKETPVIQQEEHTDEDEEAEELAILDCGDDMNQQEGGVSWEKGKPIPYSSLAYTFNLIDGTTKRLEITKYLTQYLIQVISRTPDELLKVIYLCINRLCPDYEGIELGIGESLLIKAIGSFHGVAQIVDHSKDYSQAKKVGIITKLLASCQGEEAKFIIRSLEGKLRIGLAERTVLVALANAAVRTGVGNKSNSKRKSSSEDLAKDILEGTEIVKAVFSEIPSYDLVIPALLQGGIKGLRENCKLTPGVPLKPMLAKPTKAISEVLDRFEGHKFTCEYKYDGERAQIHFLSDGSISIFSRNSENMSVKYPDMVDQLPRAIKKDVTRNFVLDAEAVAWDRSTKKILPFQELSKRKRKDVKAEEITIQVHIFAFDLLYLNDQPLINTDFSHRRSLLKEHFNQIEGEFSFATAVDVDNVEEIQTFLEQSVKAGCEGLMVKMLDGQSAHYEPSRRSMNWLKVKKDYLAGIGDSLDLVVVGAYHGKGKRTAVYGAFLLACYDPETESYQTICKLGTGFSEEVLDCLHTKLHPLELTVKKNYYDVGESKPDVWFEPKLVWEVLAADLSLSPVYSAAKGLCGDGTRGVSLRFPRYIKERDDKNGEDATSSEQVAEMYKKQASTVDQAGARNKKKKGKAGQDDIEDDFW